MGSYFRLTGDWGAPTKKAAPRPLRVGAAATRKPRSAAVLAGAPPTAVMGHFDAKLDPLGLDKSKPHPQLQPSFYGFHDSGSRQADLHRRRDGARIGDAATDGRHPHRTYCGAIGYEFMHINDPEQKDWLQRRIEGPDKQILFTARRQARDS
jgi:2-oxoglutarate dehydrogenase E1 component